MMTKLLKKDFLATTRRWMERHSEVEPIAKDALFQCVVAECYSGEQYNDRWSLSAGLGFYGLWIDSPFRHFSIPYIEEPLDFLSSVTEETVCMDLEQADDPDWLMDCQDYYDAELLLDFTGNLDAPL